MWNFVKKEIVGITWRFSEKEINVEIAHNIDWFQVTVWIDQWAISQFMSAAYSKRV